MSLRSKLQNFKRMNNIPHDKALAREIGVSQTTVQRMMSDNKTNWGIRVQSLVMALVPTVTPEDFTKTDRKKAKPFTNEDARKIMREKPIQLYRLEELQEFYKR